MAQESRREMSGYVLAQEKIRCHRLASRSRKFSSRDIPALPQNEVLLQMSAHDLTEGRFPSAAGEPRTSHTGEPCASTSVIFCP